MSCLRLKWKHDFSVEHKEVSTKHTVCAVQCSASVLLTARETSMEGSLLG